MEFQDEDIAVINGRYGPYIKHAGKNFRIPKGTDAAALTLEQCKEFIAGGPAGAGRKPYRRFTKKK